MTGNELIKILQKHPNLDLPISISVEYHPDYPLRRVFTGELLEMIINDPSEIPLLFDGYSNNDMEKDI